jgi:hypothetical protein
MHGSTATAQHQSRDWKKEKNEQGEGVGDSISRNVL